MWLDQPNVVWTEVLSLRILSKLAEMRATIQIQVLAQTYTLAPRLAPLKNPNTSETLTYKVAATVPSSLQQQLPPPLWTLLSSTLPSPTLLLLQPPFWSPLLSPVTVATLWTLHLTSSDLWLNFSAYWSCCYNFNLHDSLEELYFCLTEKAINENHWVLFWIRNENRWALTSNCNIIPKLVHIALSRLLLVGAPCI